MNSKLKEQIQPYWVEEQQGVYIPLIDKVLLKNNVPEMSYYDYMEYAKSNGVQIATRDELLQMYLQKDEINKILEKHNGDMLDTWFGSSSKHGLYSEWLVNFGSGYCYYTSNHYSYVSRAVVNLKNQKKQNTKQFDIEKYLENPKQRVVTRDVDILPRLKHVGFLCASAGRRIRYGLTPAPQFGDAPPKYILSRSKSFFFHNFL